MAEKDYTDGFFEQINYWGLPWSLHIRHYLALNEEERSRYSVEDGHFLVHMYCENQSNMFKVFLDDEEPLIWTSDADPLMVDSELVEVIGMRIDLKYNQFEIDTEGDSSLDRDDR